MGLPVLCPGRQWLLASMFPAPKPPGVCLCGAKDGLNPFAFLLFMNGESPYKILDGTKASLPKLTTILNEAVHVLS